MPAYLVIVGFISVIAAIAVALISVGWFFKDGDESTRSLREFNDQSYWGDPYGYSPWLTSKFGLWLVASGGAGVLCFIVLLWVGEWLHLAYHTA